MMKSSRSVRVLLAWIVTLTMARAFSPLMEYSGRVLKHPQQSMPFRSVQLASVSHSGTSRLWMAESGGEDDKKEEETNEEEATDLVTSADIDAEEISRIQKFRRRLFPPKTDDGLTFRQRLAKAGMSVVLSYGWVSNVSYSVTVSLAWYIFSKRTGLSPLAPGQWKSFLAVYAGFYVFNNIVRPLRFALSVSVSMYFDRVVQGIQDKFQVKKGVAVGLTVFFFNVVGTIALMCLGISIASAAAGVPVWATKAS
mmetsp:Transcript_112919/g.315473  ORF Transcript_112919/g.315473 Transcript_112919/m.315473 type:complete len:253 (+) Transcript_112919:106-864(+)